MCDASHVVVLCLGSISVYAYSDRKLLDAFPLAVLETHTLPSTFHLHTPTLETKDYRRVSTSVAHAP